VLGAAAFTPEQLEMELNWIDRHVDSKPYGLDVIMAMNYAGDDPVELNKLIPEGHQRWVEDLLQRYDVPALPENSDDPRLSGDQVGLTHRTSRKLLDVALAHPIKLVVNALGPPPADVLERCHDAGLLVGALVGTPEQALRQKAAGVDIIVAQGTEAGGHTGEISTMVLIPQVVDAVAPTPTLAAGGIATGRQIAAALALGAAGVWTGTVWLASSESEVSPLIRKKLLAATSRDTVRARCLTGKPVRMLRSEWTDAWQKPDAPDFLPMPLQGILVSDAHGRIEKYEIEPLASYPVGQAVGQTNDARSCREIMFDLLSEFASFNRN
jgi:NAD(P)H-dependent flavin oxidoreductase YrpB (nitropropane dioxygenase family)